MRHEEHFWVKRAMEGDSSAFGLLATRYLPNIRRWIGTRVSPEKVDDLSQETILRAFESIEHLADPARFEQWLRGISLNVVRMHYRSNSTKPSQVLTEQLRPRAIDDDHDAKNPTERHMIEQFRSEQVAEALMGLKSGYREALTMYYLDGMSYAQIADTLGISVAAVKSRMHRGRKQVKVRLVEMEDADMTEEDGMLKASIHEVYHAEKAGADPLAIVILKPDDEDVFVPIWVAEAEGQSILLSLKGETAPRPLTHDLMGNLLKAAGVEVERVVVTELRDNEVFYSEVRVRGRNGAVDVDARPSDAIALALLHGSDLFLSRDVLEAGGRKEISLETLSQSPEVDIAPLELPDFDEWLRRPAEEE
ncbi:MAG: bifunctional nuclease domain-containing protein [Anaerolineales bacterium]